MNKILIVGFGSIGKRHHRIAKFFFPLADIRILRREKESNSDIKTEDIFVDIKSAINFSPELTVIANPATYHLDLATQFLEIGSHLLIEKPIDTSSKKADEFIIKWNKKQVKVLIGYNLRFLSSLIEFNRLLKDHVIGKIYKFDCSAGSYLPMWRPLKDYRESVSAKKNLGGGVLLELSHEIDYIRWIFGEIVSVRAQIGKLSDLEIDVEDSAEMIIEIDSGERKLMGTLTLDLYRLDKKRECEVIGEYGTIRWNGVDGTIKMFTKKKMYWDTIFKADDELNESYENEWNHLINSIKWDLETNCTPIDGYNVLKIIEAARKSSTTGEKIILDKL